MVCAPTCIRKRTLDFGCKYRNLEKFSADVDHFLEEYDGIVEHVTAYHRSYRRELSHLYDDIELLLQKFRYIQASGVRGQLFMEKFCCGVRIVCCSTIVRNSGSITFCSTISLGFYSQPLYNFNPVMVKCDTFTDVC
uniref:Uncharacterized protein n=1 Tax=Anopheles albimanus TaxID=7167 RepID=A0A182FZM1_ANOAL